MFGDTQELLLTHSVNTYWIAISQVSLSFGILLTGIKAIRKVMEHIFFHMSGAQKINGVNLQEIFGLKNLLQALG